MDSPLDQERSQHNATSQAGETVAAGAPSVAPPAAKPTLPPAAKPVAKPAGAVVESTPERAVNKMRRRIVWSSILIFLTTDFLMFLRFFFPRALYEPKTKFLIGYPSDFGFGFRGMVS